MRTPVMAGNWKMYKTPEETAGFFARFLEQVGNPADREIVICPPFVNIPAAVAATSGSVVRIGGQNLYWKTEGAFTGEVSGPMLRAAGCTHVIVGHSERRQYFSETDETVLARTRAALEAGLTPIVCVGETLEARESGETASVLTRQFQDGIAPLETAQFGQIVIAYEPVWAIGTGRTATPAIAAEAHVTLRRLAASRFGTDPADRVRILYGGSVKPDNIQTLMAEKEIDGVLVGGASLDPVSFATITNA
ncbi:MAG: triose-phosphate isomerase [Bryobacterales bacterium]|nr:triose-phosphate isomerase [Bryobacterales bacterium]